MESARKRKRESARSRVSIQDNRGWTPLHFVIERGQVEIAKLLIEKGADVNIQNNGGRTPLYYAVICNKPKMVKLLIKKGLSCNLKDNIDCDIADRIFKLAREIKSLSAFTIDKLLATKTKIDYNGTQKLDR